jgi:ABC-type protease/lipase transport system fused ATPase/permease subunit
MYGMKISLAITAIASMPLLVSHAHAQESRIATQSARCAAIYWVLAETTADNAVRQQKFLKAASIFSELFVKEHGDKKNELTLEEAHRRRDRVLEEFRDTYASRRAYIIEESVLCGAWGEGFLVQGESYSYVPVIPKVIPQNVRSEYEATAAAAFARWLR